jgi:hypothetical protein
MANIESGRLLEKQGLPSATSRDGARPAVLPTAGTISDITSGGGDALMPRMIWTD